MFKKVISLCVVALSITTARAQGIPVIDVAGLTQWTLTVATAAEQLEQLKSQLTQMENQFNSLNGLRNVSSLMQNNLLSQYLPADYAAAYKALQAGQSGSLSGISGSLNQIATQNQYQSCEQSAGTQTAINLCNQRWQTASMNQYVGQAGYANAAQNITNLSQYLSTIQSTSDPKAMQDLQARIQLEQIKQQNEQVKLSTVKMMQDAQDQMTRLNAAASTNQMLTTGTGIRY